MTRIIAAITDDSAAQAVLATSDAIARLFSAGVDALHIGNGPSATATDAAKRVAQEAGVTLRTVAGAAVEEIIEAAAADDVAAVVIGARGTPAGRRPAGSTALALIESLEKPVVVVPPDAEVHSPIQSVLVPLDGTAASAGALREIVELAAGADLNIVVAHVRQERKLPAFSDHLPHEVRAWSDEFIARNCPAALDATLELRVGKAHEHVPSISRRSDCDLVALGWSQDLGRGRAAVVRETLAKSRVPVLLTPVSSDPSPVKRKAPTLAPPALNDACGSGSADVYAHGARPAVMS
jgi:nucleotide-binding universal stress UspA family protein